MINDELKEAVMRDLVLLTTVGIKVVLVHGGGPAINKTLEKMHIESKFENGLRVTDKDTVDVVQMVLAGKVNKDLVCQIGNMGGHAIGLSGMDGNMIKCTALDDSHGFVGEIQEVNTKLLKKYSTTILFLLFQQSDMTKKATATTLMRILLRRLLQVHSRRRLLFQ